MVTASCRRRFLNVNGIGFGKSLAGDRRGEDATAHAELQLISLYAHNRSGELRDGWMMRLPAHGIRQSICTKGKIHFVRRKTSASRTSPG